MIQRTPFANALTYGVMIFGFLLLIGPFIVIVSGASQTFQQVNSIPFSFLPQDRLFENMSAAWTRANLGTAMLNSFVMASLVTVGKVALSALTAFAIVFFRTPLKGFFFWMVFITLMLPLEVRVVPTYAVAADLFQPVRLLISAATRFRGVPRLEPSQLLRRPHAAANRNGHRNIPLPPILPNSAR